MAGRQQIRIAGIKIEGQNRWVTVIRNAKYSNMTNLSFLPANMNRNSTSNWTAGRLFLIGLGTVALSAFFVLAILPYSVWYHTQERNDYAFEWCYQCVGLPYILGPVLSIVVSAISLVTLAFGMVLTVTKVREYFSRGNHS